MKKTLIAALMLGFSITSVSGPALAGGGDAVAGAIIGGTLGLMLGGAANSHPVRRPPPPPRYYQTPEEIRYNASIQSRLNYLGYNAGPVDGVMGRRSRTAISDFQFEAGFRVTGRLTNEQVDVLFSADFERAHFNAPPPDAPLPVPPQDNASASDNADMSTGEPDIVENEPIEGNEDDNRSAAEQALPTAPVAQAPLKPLTGANTNLSFAKGEPAFFGISLGHSYDYAQKLLVENGFNDCSGQGEIVTCTSDQVGVQKRFRLGRSLKQDGQPIYMMESSTELQTDVEMSAIEKRLGETYPELVAAPNRIISDNANCALKMARMSSVDDFLDRLEFARSTPAKDPSEAVRVTVDTCDVFYKADVEQISGGYAVRVVMFNGTYLKRDFEAQQENELDRVNKALTF